LSEIPQTDQTPACIDEIALEAELARAKKAEKKDKLLSWVNQPVTLWCLSTIAIGALGFAYTNYSSCKRAQSGALERINSDGEEIAMRIARAKGVSRQFIETYNTSMSSDSLRKLVQTLASSLTPESTYYLQQFRQRTPMEIGRDVIKIAERWHSTTGVQNQEFLSLAGISLVHDKAEEALDSPDPKALEKFASDMPKWNEVIQDFHWNFRPTFATSTCIRQSVWPSADMIATN
jgi:hypothetical protein